MDKKTKVIARFDMNLWNLTTSRTWVVISWMPTSSPLVVLHDGFSRRIRLSKIGVRKPRKWKYSKISCLPVFLASSSVPTIPTASNERRRALRTYTNKSLSSQFKIILTLNTHLLQFKRYFISYSSRIKITSRQYLYSHLYTSYFCK